MREREPRYCRSIVWQQKRKRGNRHARWSTSSEGPRATCSLLPLLSAVGVPVPGPHWYWLTYSISSEWYVFIDRTHLQEREGDLKINHTPVTHNQILWQMSYPVPSRYRISLAHFLFFGLFYCIRIRSY